MKKVLFVFLLGLQLVNAQKYELGEVTKAELEEKKHPIDSSATAAILFNLGKTSLEYSENAGFKVVTEVTTKIKIYTKEGLEWANKEVSFYTGGNDKEFVDFSKAVTYNLVNGSIEKTKLKREGEFEEETNKFWTKKKITMPNVKEGSIIEYTYTIKSPFISSLPDWYFQKAIPVNYSEFTTKIPEYYIYNAYRKGGLFPKETVSKEEKTVNFQSKERVSSMGGRVTSTNYSSNDVRYVETHTKFTLENVPAIKEENYVLNINNYAAGVQHELAGSNMPGAMFKSYSVTWEDVVKSIYGSENFGAELEKTNYFNEDLKNLIANSKSLDEKIATIFEYVKSNINWDGYNALYCDKGVKKAYKEKVGNVAEINLISVAMLREVGFEVNPVLVSTRSNGIAYYPSRTAFNYVIAAVELDGKYILLDATSKNAVPNVLPSRAVNWIGRVVKKDGRSYEINLTNRAPSNEQLTIMCAINAAGKVDGKLRDIYNDYYAFDYREDNGGLTADTYLEKLQKENKGVVISEVNTKNTKEFYKPIVEAYSFSSDNLVEVIGERMYFSPMLFFQIKENPFKAEERTYPVEFDFPFNDSFNIIVKIPEGYEVESMPEPIELITENNYGAFKYNISKNLDNIQLVGNFSINTSLIPTEGYHSIKLFFREMIKKQSEKIVLKKK